MIVAMRDGVETQRDHLDARATYDEICDFLDEEDFSNAEKCHVFMALQRKTSPNWTRNFVDGKKILTILINCIETGNIEKLERIKPFLLSCMPEKYVIERIHLRLFAALETRGAEDEAVVRIAQYLKNTQTISPKLCGSQIYCWLEGWCKEHPLQAQKLFELARDHQLFPLNDLRDFLQSHIQPLIEPSHYLKVIEFAAHNGIPLAPAFGDRAARVTVWALSFFKIG